MIAEQIGFPSPLFPSFVFSQTAVIIVSVGIENKTEVIFCFHQTENSAIFIATLSHMIIESRFINNSSLKVKGPKTAQQNYKLADKK